MGWEDVVEGRDEEPSEAKLEAETRKFQDELVAEIAAGGGDLSLVEYQLDRYRTRAWMAGGAGVLGIAGVVILAVLMASGLEVRRGLKFLAAAGIVAVLGLGGMTKLLLAHRSLKKKLADARRARAGRG